MCNESDVIKNEIELCVVLKSVLSRLAHLLH